MLVFVDESGDCGRKVSSGSTPHFVVTLVIFEDNEEAERADERISLLRHELRLAPTAEFHFSKTSHNIRQQFLNIVLPYDFFYFSIVINKSKLYGPGFQYKEPFYKYACSLVFENAKPYLNKATVIFDGHGSREFRAELEKYLKQRVNSDTEKIKSLKLQESRRNNLIQLADMICGAVARSFKSDRPGRGVYRKIIKAREFNVQVWPR